jgi:hypothetical protein
MSPAICKIRQSVEFFTNISIFSKSENCSQNFSIDLCLKLNYLHDVIVFIQNSRIKISKNLTTVNKKMSKKYTIM